MTARTASSRKKAQGQRLVLGDFPRDRQPVLDEALLELPRQILRLQDQERRRVGRALHDGVAQNLIALQIALHAIDQLVPPATIKVKALLAQCTALANETVGALRTVTYLLHPPVLDALGLPGAVSDFIEGFGQRTGIKIALVISKGFGRLSADVETALYRVVQESLTNVHRHSGSGSAHVRMRRGKRDVIVEVQDAGTGIPSATLRLPSAPGSVGVGIAGMRERLKLLHGRLEIESGPVGTLVRATVPWSCGS